MLIEFSVQNHRVFRTKQTFTMAATATTQRAGHGHVLDTGFTAMPYVLTEACLLGANGSGKSSLINAMAAMKHFVLTSGKHAPNDSFMLQPFAFDAESRDVPSEYEIIFLKDDLIYQYGFALTAERVVEEWLFVRSKTTGRERRIFSREFIAESGNYDWYLNPGQLKGERDSWKLQTLDNALFLSTAVQLKAEHLTPAFDWITQSWQLMDSTEFQSHLGLTTEWIKEDEKKRRILDFLSSTGIEISDASVEEKNLPAEVLPMLQAFFEQRKDSKKPNINEMKIPEVTTYRIDSDGVKRALPFVEESTGTRALFGLSAAILDVLDKGKTLVVDELNTGLHPLAFQHLVGLFASREVNRKGAQLIFTTHDTSVADQECLGRDQIWIVEKDPTFSARLVPLTDFKERDAKGFQKKYLDGRFGGVPKLFR